MKLYHYCSLETLFSIIVLGPQCRISVEKLKSQLCLLNNNFDSDKIQIKYSRFYNQ